MIRDGALPVDGEFRVGTFLARVASGEAPDTWIVERLRRKVEVAKRVACAYSADLVRPVSQQNLDQEGLERLFALFLAEAERCDVRSLNTVLKMADGLVPGPTLPLPPDVVARVARLLDSVVVPDA